MTRPYQICVRCVMDTTDPEIKFDENGVCSHCLKYNELAPSYKLTETESDRRLKAIAEEIKTNSAGKEYDSILGMSGGTDSSYVAYLAKKLDLRTLVVHLDNGWDSEIAVTNIKNIVEKCGFDLYTHVIDWPEFCDLQRSFLKASVIDIEMLTDHAIMGVMFKKARGHKIKYILSGTNFATEHGLPISWVWRKSDVANIKAIHKKFGTLKIKSFPTLGTFKMTALKSFRFIKYVEPLNNINYKKTEAIKILNKEFGWRYYGGKHYESIFTKFYQAYILPTKFGIDKRKSHLSCLIRNGEITREEALEELGKPIYKQEELDTDKEYVLKKLGFTEEEFDEIMALKPRPHTYYRSDQKYYQKAIIFYNLFKRIFR